MASIQIYGTMSDIGGGSSAKAFTLVGETSWLSGEDVTITDEENLAVLNAMKAELASGNNINLQISLPTGSTYYVYKSVIPEYDEFGNTYVYGFGYIGVFGIAFVDVHVSYSSSDDAWTVKLTDLNNRE